MNDSNPAAPPEKEFCSWTRENHFCRRYHVEVHKRVVMSICGALAVFLMLLGHGIATFGWNPFWADSSKWGYVLLVYGGICAIGGTVVIFLEETSAWKYFLLAVGLPALVFEISRLAQSGIIKALYG